MNALGALTQGRGATSKGLDVDYWGLQMARLQETIEEPPGMRNVSTLAGRVSANTRHQGAYASGYPFSVAVARYFWLLPANPA